MIGRISKLGGLTAAAVVLAGIVSMTSGPAMAEMESSLARGGKLYDKWYAVIKADKPTESHSLYPSDGQYADKAASNWRCKECHGWDYLGKDGAYASGKHATGIEGINGMKGADTADIVALLKADEHGIPSFA